MDSRLDHSSTGCRQRAGGREGSSAVTAVIANASPLAPESGHYLQATLAAANTDAGIGRPFVNTATSDGVDVTNPVTFEFNIRLEPSLSGFSSGNDYLTIHNHPGLITSSGATTWLIRLTGGSSPQWQVYDGNRDGGFFNPALLVNTNMAVTPGTTSKFTVVADPGTRGYSSLRQKQ